MSDDMAQWPLDDDEADALLSGAPTRRDELASLERFIQDLRVAEGLPVPRPSAELARLFSEGQATGVSDIPAASSAADGPGAPPSRTGGTTKTGRKPVRKLVKVAAATTTAALAVTLAAAAQVLPGTQPKSPISVSGPATPVQMRGEQRATAGPAQPTAGVEVSLQHTSTSATGRTTTTVRLAAGTDLNALSTDALLRLPLDILRTLSGDALARLPVEVLRTLPGDALARLPLDVIRILPGDVLGRLPLDNLRVLPGDVLGHLPVEVLRLLPLEALLRLSGDVLARLPLDLLRALPADVQNRLPADVLRLLLPSPATTATTTSPARS